MLRVFCRSIDFCILFSLSPSNSINDYFGIFYNFKFCTFLKCVIERFFCISLGNLVTDKGWMMTERSIILSVVVCVSRRRCSVLQIGFFTTYKRKLCYPNKAFYQKKKKKCMRSKTNNKTLKFLPISPSIHKGVETDVGLSRRRYRYRQQQSIRTRVDCVRSAFVFMFFIVSVLLYTFAKKSNGFRRLSPTSKAFGADAGTASFLSQTMICTTRRVNTKKNLNYGIVVRNRTSTRRIARNANRSKQTMFVRRTCARRHNRIRVRTSKHHYYMLGASRE